METVRKGGTVYKDKDGKEITEAAYRKLQAEAGKEETETKADKSAQIPAGRAAKK